MQPLRLGAHTVLVIAMSATLVSCTPAPAPSASPTPSASSSAAAAPVVAAPLTCAELVSPEDAAAALTGADGVAPELVEAVQPSYAIDLAVLTGAGGLSCSWRAGAGQTVFGAERGDFAYLTVRVLPDAASDWVVPYAGDTPSEEHKMIGQIDAMTTAGESGWSISAPVGTAWVDVTVTASGLISGGSRFSGAAFDRVLDGMVPVAESSFAAVESATADEMSWPALAFREGEGRCDADLAQAGIENALQLGGVPVNYQMLDSRTGTIYGLENAVSARIGTFRCQLSTEGYGMTWISVIRGFAPIAQSLATLPDISATLEPVALEGSMPGEIALQAIYQDGPSSPLYFTVGDTFFIVDSDGAVPVAEAIIAQTR